IWADAGHPFNRQDVCKSSECKTKDPEPPCKEETEASSTLNALELDSATLARTQHISDLEPLPGASTVSGIKTTSLTELSEKKLNIQRDASRCEGT
ncbi:unnamed protein product, partial [Protopolystoma xenopodis]